MNIKFYKKLIHFSPQIALLRAIVYGILKSFKLTNKWFLSSVSFIALMASFILPRQLAHSAEWINEPVQACVFARDVDLTASIRDQYAQCLGWKTDESSPVCHGSYYPVTVAPLANPDEVRIMADKVSFYRDQRSTLSGNVEVQQTQRIVNAQTAHVYRDVKTNQVTRIEFLGAVRYLEPDKLMIARRATINPQDKSGEVEDVLYRFNTQRHGAMLPAWGRAELIKRFANRDYLLKQATYTTCAPQDKAWDIEAQSITLDDAKGKGVARNARLRIRQWPVLYTPYLSFPTNRDRKSGFLMPQMGYSNVGGFDLGVPYYLNLAPNYDLTITPHLYTERGVMMGGEYRFLTPNSTGILNGNFLPNDRAYGRFLQDNELLFPRFRDMTRNRWAFGIFETTYFTSDLQLHVNVKEVSDDYYLQDFSTNLAAITERQMLRQADITYATEHWSFRGMGQSYHTLHPINQTPISPAYERLPQLMARGFYYDLPFNANLNILGQYDQFQWPDEIWEFNNIRKSQGPRFHFNPVLSLPLMKPWGYITPSVQVVENYYNVQNNWTIPDAAYNRTIPRYSVDGGLFFERNTSLRGTAYTQTLEPRLFYLRVPYDNQTPIPVYDTGYMIFNADQLFRTNRFSGFDRIGDANQLSYAVTSRWLFEETGAERANFSIGQIKYFSDRKVQLCQNQIDEYCIDDMYTFGFLSPIASTSPIASRAVYHLTPHWDITGDYIWDTERRSTNNADLNVHYQPATNAIISAGYSYLFNGDITQIATKYEQNNALHQAIVAFSWPLREKWSTIGAYSHNISKHYGMMSLLGVQYDSCCWAVRVLGGRTFKNLDAQFDPRYNNNVYLQVLLKGLGSVANSDPYNILSTYIPGYDDPFRR